MAIGTRIASLFAEIGADVSGLKRGLAEAEGSLGRTSKSLSTFGLNVTDAQAQIGLMSRVATTGFAALGAAAVAGIGAAIKVGMDFEQQMDAVQSVSGATAAEMGRLGQAAMGMGAAWGQSAAEVGRGMEELAKAGVSTRDIMGGAAEAVTTLAAAGGVDLAEAAEVAATSMKVFGLEGRDMAHVADMVAGAANASVIGVNDYRLSMQMASAVMAQAGQTFDDATVAIALMGEAGIKGSDAGTSLKTMFLSLSPATKEAGEMMRQLGIIAEDGSNRFFDAAGKTRSYRDIAQVLQESLRGLSQEQQQAALRTIFGTDAIRSATVAVKAGAEGFDLMNEAVRQTSAMDVARIRTDNLAGSINRLRATAENYAVGSGPGLMRAVRGGADALADFIATLDVTSNATIKQRQEIGALTKEGYSFAQAWAIVRARSEEAAVGVATFNRQLPDTVAGAKEAAGAVLNLAQQMSAAIMKAEGVSIRYTLMEEERWKSSQTTAKKIDEAMDESARKEEQRLARLASEAESAAKRAVEAFKGLERDTGRALRDVDREMAGLGVTLMSLQQDFGDRWISQWFEVDRAIKTAQQSAEDALRALNDTEFLNAGIANQRKALDERLRGEDKAHRQAVEDSEALHDLDIALSRADDDKERVSIRQRFEWAKQDRAHRRKLDDDEDAWRQYLDRERAELEKELHEAEVGRRRAAILAERNTKIDAINAEWREWQDTESKRLEEAKKNARQDAAERLAALKENFFDKLEESAAPGTQKFAEMMASKISSALASIAMPEFRIPSASGGGGGGGGGGTEVVSAPSTSGKTWQSEYNEASGLEGWTVGALFEATHGKDNARAVWEAENAMGRASGGPVAAGQAYIVGEHRPELFIPDRSGYIVPSVGGGGVGPVYITITGNTMLGDDTATARELARTLKPWLDRVVVGAV